MSGYLALEGFYAHESNPDISAKSFNIDEPEGLPKQWTALVLGSRTSSNKRSLDLSERPTFDSLLHIFRGSEFSLELTKAASSFLLAQATNPTLDVIAESRCGTPEIWCRVAIRFFESET
jgi:hypothetical protein